MTARGQPRDEGERVIARIVNVLAPASPLVREIARNPEVSSFANVVLMERDASTFRALPTKQSALLKLTTCRAQLFAPRSSSLY